MVGAVVRVGVELVRLHGPYPESMDLLAALEDINRMPLEMIDPDQAGDVVRDVFDRHSEEAPVGVARFGSAI
jgi:hypothetical protein